MSHDRGCYCGREKYEYDDCTLLDCHKKKKKEKKKMTHHPLPTANVIDVLNAILDDMLVEEAENEKGDIRVAYLQRAIEILTEFEKGEDIARELDTE